MIGFLIGYVAESKKWLYVTVPTLLIRSVQTLPFAGVFFIPGTKETFSFAMALSIIVLAVMASLLGGLSGNYARNLRGTVD